MTGERKMMKTYISWRRVSTKKQGASGLGLEAQKEIINHFVKAEGGKLIADYSEVYTGKDLAGCTELRRAMDHCRHEGATLIIAKTDRFRNTVEALGIYEEMQGNIYFCDLPHTDKFTLTLFFALAEREALLVSLRTKQALHAKAASGWKAGRKTGACLTEATKASAEARRRAAAADETNRLIWTLCRQNIAERPDGMPSRQDFENAAKVLAGTGAKTARGHAFDFERTRMAYYNLRKIFL